MRYIEEVYNPDRHDGLIFVLDKNDNLEVSAFTYNNNDKPLTPHELGYKYHIITYTENKENKDLFEAIIGNPKHYVTNLIKAGFLGMICKKTENSTLFVNKVFGEL